MKDPKKLRKLGEKVQITKRWFLLPTCMLIFPCYFHAVELF